MAPSVEDTASPPEAGRIPPTPPLLPVPDDVALPGDELCTVCAGLKLTARRFIVFPGDREYQQWAGRFSKPVPLGLITELRKKTHCPLCRLVLVALGGDRVPEVDRQERPVRAVIRWGTGGRNPSRDEPGFLSDIRLMMPELSVESGSFPDMDITSVNIFPEITLLVNDAPPDTPREALRFLPRLTRRDGIDFDLVRRWLAICEARHGGVCASERTMRDMGWESPQAAVPAFRCIDLEQECLVLMRNAAPTADPRYAALSYMWGRAGSDEEFFKTLKANIAEREVPGFFAREESRRRLPATISDAMTVARRLGLRYLWVDSLCIVQDGSGEEKLDAIRKMDIVYGAAHVVIRAVGSLSAFAGIEGIVEGRGRGPAGDMRIVEQIASGVRLAFRARLSHDLEDPATRLPYYTRGWTYQEGFFACRTMTFSDGTVSFECHSGLSFAENYFEDTSLLNEPVMRSFPGDRNDIGEMEGHIQTYSDRQLTSETDIYRAFAGVAREMRRRFRCDLCQGLPTRFFDWFLLWQPMRDDAPVRRTVAPSWSWAGWHGSAWSRIWDWYTRDMEVVRRGIKKRTWIIWYQRLAHGSTVCVPVRKLKKDPRGGQLNLYGGQARKRERFGIDCSVTKPTARILTALGVPSYTEDILSEMPGSGFLQFWTVSAVFELRRPGHWLDGEYGPRPPKQQSEQRSYRGARPLPMTPPDVDSNNENSEELRFGSPSSLGGFPKSGELGYDSGSDDLSQSEEDSSEEEDPEFDPDKQPGDKLIIAGKSGRAIGRIYVPKWWKGLDDIYTRFGEWHHEFILLCEARDARAKNFSLVDEDGGWRYRVMLLEPKLGGLYHERVAVGSIGLTDLNEAVAGPTWKEFILG
ncbi:hypothetical protein DL765_004244 [Monosporascus sp. GIB2]|nr:hypothetical protein DL765_004244 [Monosporascus sp. GIB2]